SELIRAKGRGITPLPSLLVHGRTPACRGPRGHPRSGWTDQGSSLRQTLHRFLVFSQTRPTPLGLLPAGFSGGLVNVRAVIPIRRRGEAYFEEENRLYLDRAARRDRHYCYPCGDPLPGFCPGPREGADVDLSL